MAGMVPRVRATLARPFRALPFLQSLYVRFGAFSTIAFSPSSLTLLLDFRPRVPQSHGPVERERVRGRVPVHTEVSEALELEYLANLRARDRRLQLAPGHHLQRLRV